ncbi:MAG: protein kinase [Acholeplasmataceae bacterium]|jgi:serine/threonine protein kinase|nr:protein kinase [Acholeplasmataceae bacterium]
MRKIIGSESGGNSNVLFYDDNTCEKRLQLQMVNNNIVSQRFEVEKRIMKQLMSKKYDNLVEVLEINDDCIKMRSYQGNVTQLYEKTKGNPEFVLKSMLGIIELLEKLSSLSQPIYHRDLKPNNILFDTDHIFYLTDFGCALSSEQERITPKDRAIGSLHYRAPEYEFGKVDNLNQMGDIFSIGKIIWNLIRGEKNLVFPFNLWFPKEYNLSTFFPENNYIPKINVLIAKCVSINPKDRPTYKELIADLKEILNSSNIVSFEILDNQDILEMNAKNELIRIEQEQKNIDLNKIFVDDLSKVLDSLKSKYTGLDMFDLLLKDFNEKRENIFEKTKMPIIESNLLSVRNGFASINIGITGTLLSNYQKDKFSTVIAVSLFNMPSMIGCKIQIYFDESLIFMDIRTDLVPYIDKYTYKNLYHFIDNEFYKYKESMK